MSISSGHLESLLNATFPLGDYGGVDFQSYTASPTLLGAGPTTLLGATVASTGVTGLDGVTEPDGTGTVTYVDEATNLITVSEAFDGTTSLSSDEYVIGFSPTALLVSLSNSQMTASLLLGLPSGDLGAVDGSVFLLSDTPIPSGAIVTLTADGSFTDPVPCFCRGTRIETQRGSQPVESLAIGDVVCTHHAGWAPIRWIGRARVDCRRHSQPDDVTPIRVRAGAFGPEMPSRDVLLSPGHAVFANGRLISV